MSYLKTNNKIKKKSKNNSWVNIKYYTFSQLNPHHELLNSNHLNRKITLNPFQN